MTKLLVCDQCEFYCCHTYCCNPPLHRVPIEPWYCGFCAQDMDIPDSRSTVRNNRTRTGTNNSNANRNNSATSRSNRNIPTTNMFDNAVTRSIRNSLSESSFLRGLFDAADKQGDKGYKRSISRRRSTRRGTSDKTKKTKKAPKKKTTKSSTKKRSSSKRQSNGRRTSKK